MRLQEIQKSIHEEGADAWVLVDYENRNPVVAQLLLHKMLTRKIVLILPKDGKGQIICHSIDEVFLRGEEIKKNFDLHIYKTWQEMLDQEKAILSGYKTVLMDYSENGLLMRVALADFGSVDFVKKLGLEVKSSTNVLQAITARITEKGRDLQRKACKIA